MAVGSSQFPGAIDTAETLIQAANSSSTTLSASANPNATTLTVGSTLTFPNSGTLVIDDEILYYTGKTPSTFTGVTRGEEGTTPNSHSVGTEVTGPVIASHHNVLVNGLIKTQTQIGTGIATIPEKLAALDARITALEQGSGGGTTLPATLLASDYGASGSDVQTTGTIAAGSQSLQVASAASFSVGQGIFIAGAGSASDATGDWHVSKITAISGTTITLETGAVRAANNVVVKHDDTAALQAFIQAVWDEISATGIIAGGTYFCNGPIRPETNSILYIPMNLTAAGIPNHAVRLVGASPNPNSAWLGLPPTACPVFRTERIGTTEESSILAAALFEGGTTDTPANATAIYLENINFRTYANPRMSGLDMGMAANIVCRNCMIDNGVPVQSSPEPTHLSTFGLRLPRVNMTNLALTENVGATGYGIGIIFSEEWVSIYSAASLCKVGLKNTFAYHPSTGRVTIWQCKTGIEFTDRVAVDFHLDFEMAPPGHWAESPAGRQIYDPTNLATGILRVHASAGGSGTVTAPSATGADHLHIWSVNGFPGRAAELNVKSDLIAETAARVRGDLYIPSGIVSAGLPDSETAGYRALRVPNSSRLAGLVSYWKLDEATGARADSHGANALAMQGTVGSAAGLLGQAAVLTATSGQCLTCASNASLETGDVDFSVALWVKLAAKAADYQIIGKTGAGLDEWGIAYQPSSDRFRFFIKTSGGAYPEVVASNAAAPVVGTWYFIAAWHNATADTLNISVNAGAANTLAVPDGFPAAAGEPLIIGGYNPTVNNFNGSVDEVQFRKGYLWSTDDLTYFYGAGTPPAYPFS